MYMGRKGKGDGKVKKQISHCLSAFPSTEREYNILLLSFPIRPFCLIEKAIVYGCLCTWPFTQRKSSTRFVLFFSHFPHLASLMNPDPWGFNL